MANDSINDNNYLDLKYNGWKQTERTVTFDGTAGAGAVGTAAIFDVSGEVLAKVLAVCTTSVTGTSLANVSLGVTGSASYLITTTSPGTALAAGEIWHDATPDSRVEASSVMSEKVITDGSVILLNVGGSNLTGGAVKLVCLWKPISLDGDLTRS